MYVNYYKREITTSDENPPIGILLCAEKNNTVAQFILPEDNKEIFISNINFIFLQKNNWYNN
jgi:hypothetical protein